MTFAELIDAIDELSQDEQQELIDIVRKRLAEARRRRLAADISEARKEYASGQGRTVTPQELVREIRK